MTKFGRLNPDGSYEEIADIDQSVMRKCPHFIMVPEHYREDGTCRCNDVHHEIMSTWGYVWDDEKLLWVAPDDEEDD